METLILARHAHARSNESGLVSGAPPGEGLSPLGVEQARAARALLAGHEAGLGVASRFVRTRETLRLLAPGVPELVMAELDEVGFGSFEGGSLEDYRTWAWSAGPEAACPGGGESRAAAAARIARGLALLLARPEETIVAVSHSMPIRYVLDAAAGRRPGRRLVPVGHVEPFLLPCPDVARAAEHLAAWARSPSFSDGADAT